MKLANYFGVLVVSCGLLIACAGESDDSINIETNTEEMAVDTVKFLSDLNALETRINNSLEMPKEKDLVEAIVSYQDFAAIFPNDPKAPDYLLRASDFSLTTGQPKKSVDLLGQIIAKYPDYDRMEDVKYNRASHLDFELRDTTEAKEAYQEFMETYPNSTLVSDCKSRIKNIRYSMEELTEMFMKNIEENGNLSEMP